MRKLEMCHTDGISFFGLIGIPLGIPIGIPFKLRSGQKCKKGQMMESLMGYGWLMRQMCPCGMPSLADGGTMGGTL